MTSHRSSSPDPRAVAIRKIVADAKKAGILRGPGDPVEIKKGTSSGAAQWLDIDPETAERMLCANTGNRSLSSDTVNAFAREMANGEWQATHQGIAFDTDGKLIDGQHRLHAIARAGVTVRMMVTYDIPARPEGKKQSAMDCIDRGRSRSTANQLKLQHGIKEASKVSAICAGIANLCSKIRVRRIGVGQTLEIYQEFKDAIDWVVENRTTTKGLRARGVATGFAFALAGSEGLAAESVKYMWTGLMGRCDAPQVVCELREFLLGDEAKLLTKNQDKALAELTLQTLFLTVENRADARLELSQEGADYYRGLQGDRVKSIAKQFQLPTP